MNRGKRRGHSYGSLTSLRESVRRRLCDVNAVPFVPDPKVQVSRLMPTKYAEIDIPSSLTKIADPPTATQPGKSSKEIEFQRQVFETEAIVEYAFHHGFGRRTSTASESTNGGSDQSEHAPAAKLLVNRKEIDFWSTGVLGLCSEPDDWFPTELIPKRKRPASKAVENPKRVRFDETVEQPNSDLDNIPDPALLELEETANDDDNIAPAAETEELADVVLDPTNAPEGGDEDSEDDRWNGDQPALDDDDGDGGDYFEAYDNEENGGIDDFNVDGTGDEDGDDLRRYYD